MNIAINQNKNAKNYSERIFITFITDKQRRYAETENYLY
jgi:hypothetical protein